MQRPLPDAGPGGVDARTHGRRSDQYAVSIIEAVESNQPTTIHGNVPNRGLIAGLPQGCCVEVACRVDAGGVEPTPGGDLPPQLAALNRTNVNVQELIVEAALTGSRDHVYHAVQLDPLTGAVCTLPQIRAMVDEMLEAQARWLPRSRDSPSDPSLARLDSNQD